MPVISYGNIFKVCWRKTTTSIAFNCASKCRKYSLPPTRTLYLVCITIASCLQCKKKALCFRVAIDKFLLNVISHLNDSMHLYFFVYPELNRVRWLCSDFHFWFIIFFVVCVHSTSLLTYLNQIQFICSRFCSFSILSYGDFLLLLKRHMFFCSYLICICLVLAVDLAIVFKYRHVHLLAYASLYQCK